MELSLVQVKVAGQVTDVVKALMNGLPGMAKVYDSPGVRVVGRGKLQSSFRRPSR